MDRSRSIWIIGLGIAAAVGLLLTLLQGEAPTEPIEVSILPDSPGSPGSPGPSAPTPRAPEPLSVPEAEPVEPAEEAVFEVGPYPLRIDLDLVWRDGEARVPGVRPLGTGRDARLVGQMANARGEGVPATVEIVAGPNLGRKATCDRSGRFELEHLYAGLVLVQVKGPGIVGARREVLLGRDRTSELNLGFGRLAGVIGQVENEKREPIAGAEVIFDGQKTFTDEEGRFEVPHVAAGGATVELAAEGYALYREKVNVTAGVTLSEENRLRYTLRKEAQCVLSVDRSQGTSDPAFVYFTPSNSNVQRRTPWYRLHPVRVFPGTTTRVRGLPPGPVHVRAFHAGVRAEPRYVSLRDDKDTLIDVEFESGERVTGIVSQDGEPVVGASVRLEPPDRGRALLAYLRQPSSVMADEILPMLPPAEQTTTTDIEGRFVFSAWSDAAPQLYLEARGPDGTSWDGRIVTVGEEDLELELRPIDRGSAELRVRTPGRTRGLEVEVHVTGRDGPERHRLRASEDLLVEDLVPGQWRLRASWERGELSLNPALAIEDRTDVELALPLELSGPPL